MSWDSPVDKTAVELELNDLRGLCNQLIEDVAMKALKVQAIISLNSFQREQDELISGIERPRVELYATEMQPLKGGLNTDAIDTAREFERSMDKTLDNGDLDEIKEMITAHKLTKCKTNSLEKSLEVSYRLKNLAQTTGPNAEGFNSLANTVEEFALELIEPLKSDDRERAIFEGEDFDRIAEKAVLFHQKKFVSHPVVYNLLMKRWAGPFHHLRSNSWFDLKTLKWFLLNVWTVFDVVLFPLVFLILYLVHLVIGLVKTRKGYRIVLLINATWKKDPKTFLKAMEGLSRTIMDDGRANDSVKYASILCDKSQVKKYGFECAEEAARIMNSDSPKDEINTDSTFEENLKIARTEMFESLRGPKRNKVVVVMTDKRTGEPLHNITSEVQLMKDMGVRVISVGFGVNPEIKELVAMTTSEKDVILYQGDATVHEVSVKVLKKIRGYDIFDQYIQYFVTPYFIFLRDTLSYLVLLALHFAICLQPSTLHFTTLEWVILCFFVGRLLMEIYQAAMEKNSSDKPGHCRDRQMEKEKRKKSEKRNTISNVLFNIISRYFSDWWNVLDLLTLAMYTAILVLRLITWAEHYSVSQNRLLAVAEYLYGLNAMFMTLRVFGHIMESPKSTGSIQIALFQIIGAVLAILGQFVAVILAFSLAITKVYVAEISYSTARNSTSHGFCQIEEGGIACWWGSATHLIWSLLGDTNSDPMESSDPASDVLAKLLYGAFLVMAVVMVMNMMIALLSNTYQKVEDNAFYEWSYRKATTIRTYNNYHPVPVPFNIISLTGICLWRICINLCRRKRQKCLTVILDSFFDCLVLDLQEDYFSVHADTLPIAESSKIDRVLKESDGNNRLIEYIANQVFKYDKKEARELGKEMKDRTEVWDTRGISIKGNQLMYIPCKCSDCKETNTKYHGARFKKQLSKEWPGFEVLIQETGERRLIAIGVVTLTHNCHKFPGWEDSGSAGYHIDDGRIFDVDNQDEGKECEGAMARRGDLIGCKILYDHPSRDDTSTVSFTLNGRVIGEGNVKNQSGTLALYPFVGIGSDGIALLFKMCSSGQNEVFLEKDYSDKMLEKIHDEICLLRLRYEDREQLALQDISSKLENLEQKIDTLSSDYRVFKEDYETFAELQEGPKACRRSSENVAN